MKTFADYDEANARSREAHVAALEAQRETALAPGYTESQDVVRRISEATQQDDPRSKVYFLQESGIGAIKIGTSRNVAMRVRSLSRGIPHELVLLATMRGGFRVEALVKNLFRQARIRGEWFRPVPELLEYITGVIA